MPSLQSAEHSDSAFDINATIDSCGICEMALGTLGVEKAASAL
jgi:hypothetical protein